MPVTTHPDRRKAMEPIDRLILTLAMGSAILALVVLIW
jgi:hypothetical protein